MGSEEVTRLKVYHPPTAHYQALKAKSLKATSLEAKSSKANTSKAKSMGAKSKEAKSLDSDGKADYEDNKSVKKCRASPSPTYEV